MNNEEDFKRSMVEKLPILTRYARKLTRSVDEGDDLIQSTIARALTKRHLFAIDSNMRSWLFSIMHNEYVTVIRRNVIRGLPQDLEHNNKLELGIKPSQEDALRMRDMQRALERLNPLTRKIILMVGRDGFSYRRVAELLNMPEGTVRPRLSRGRETLRRLMGEEPRRYGQKTIIAQTQQVQ